MSLLQTPPNAYNELLESSTRWMSLILQNVDSLLYHQTMCGQWYKKQMRAQPHWYHVYLCNILSNIIHPFQLQHVISVISIDIHGFKSNLHISWLEVLLFIWGSEKKLLFYIAKPMIHIFACRNPIRCWKISQLGSLLTISLWVCWYTHLQQMFNEGFPINYCLWRIWEVLNE